MIKKITLGLIICCVLMSCGKKGDPKYVNLKIEIKIHKTLKNKA